jgi:hypothetical protein
LLGYNIKIDETAVFPVENASKAALAPPGSIFKVIQHDKIQMLSLA